MFKENEEAIKRTRGGPHRQTRLFRHVADRKRAMALPIRLCSRVYTRATSFVAAKSSVSPRLNRNKPERDKFYEREAATARIRRSATSRQRMVQ